ncbi:MAG: hypothetical protein A2428_02995 [Bdellovibrionales bacterium RIFOXYC1_FULL_54_43]|nr:MAG: hypothetical protein A2428_02995 [Bdellovibrionales bacterium RIFOXYC1_FULL_54_43]OFZ82648.1 MAG: hypothetical protein A2603_02430 [Bdellovibrionales bacterium RIFOXYD1_FULL_55_31]
MNSGGAFWKTVRAEDALLRSFWKNFPCWSCGQPPGNDFNPVDYSHVLTIGAGRPDAWFNGTPQCRRCHTAFENNRLEFIDAHPKFWNRLRLMGWKIEIFVGKRRLWHPYLEGAQ